jgi:transcription factor SPT20
MGLPNAANGMTTQQQRFLQQQQLSQAPTSSPIVQNATPHNGSSPMTAGNIDVQMRHSTSSLGGSPPRPGSVVPQNPQMTPVVAHAMRAQGSQQSHAGTPRVSQGTPNMAQEVLRQTPRMSQSSPMPGHMVQVPQMGGAHMMPNQIMNTQMQQAQIIAQQQQMQQRMRQQAAQQAMSSSPMNSQQMTPQQIALQQQIAQHQMQQGNAGMMAGNPMAISYNAQMRAMAAAQAQQNSMQQNGQGFMGRGGAMTPQMVQQAQHQAALQAQQQGQMQQQGQPNIIQQRIQGMARHLYQSQIASFMGQFPGGQAPPEAHNSFKQQCQTTARQKVGQQVLIQQQQQNAMRQQQQQQQQQGHMMAGQNIGMGQGMNMGMNMGMQGNMNVNMNANMNGNMNGAGMQRPSGM